MLSGLAGISDKHSYLSLSSLFFFFFQKPNPEMLDFVVR